MRLAVGHFLGIDVGSSITGFFAFNVSFPLSSTYPGHTCVWERISLFITSMQGFFLKNFYHIQLLLFKDEFLD